MPVRLYLHSAFAVLMLFSLVCSVAARMGHADAPIAGAAEDVQPLSVGDAAPRFTVQTVADEDFVFDPSQLERPAVLITFRGGWCPYCNFHLAELRHVIGDIDDLGVDVYFLSGDRPQMLYASLSGETQSAIDGLDYKILSDANAQAALAFGIAFRPTAGTKTYLEEKGRDIEGSSIRRHDVLPVPAVFAVDRRGTIQFAHVNADYKVRLPAEELLDVAQMIAATD